MKFTREGDDITITVQRNDDVNKEQEQQGQAVVSIKDTGMGIDPHIFSRLFTKFAKSDTGTGLGLFICKGIIEAHGGRIWAENNADGKGATFAFSLPIVKNK